MKKTLLSLTALAMITTACGNDNTPEENLNENIPDNGNAGDNLAENNEEEDTEEAETEDTFPVTITDDAGRDVTIEEEPETLASLLPSSTEILFALDAGDRLIGRSEFCNFPPEDVEDIAVIGAMEIDAEQILSLEPELLFVQESHLANYSEILDEFSDAGIDYLVIEGAESFQATYEAIELIGDATGTREAADSLVSQMEADIGHIAEQAEAISEEDRKLVWTEVSPSPDIFTAGAGTFFDEMLSTINADNAAGDHNGWVQLNEEEMISLNPDVIITTYGYYVENAYEEVAERDGWQGVPAVENGEIHDVDNDTLSRPGPRLVEGVETLARLIYPDVFE
ncbi:ABC transporter substrate-binding protein [Salisediminibacterium selenitireducens]|uniref:Periplasmic binding protein n=1 Tax=Bacillus selenitireducens (strain ATCC 700615 / DSM 15326 / MLS10) TaxID=439292 RepID=D6XZA2_BACIE|nr:ABC transporter substrate-binding protein [Salisediminibacterium selenitireducens]ADI00387.1 periplasmic binding protein [[Bacillus] selenitireducens MLS10]